MEWTVSHKHIHTEHMILFFIKRTKKLKINKLSQLYNGYTIFFYASIKKIVEFSCELIIYACFRCNGEGNFSYRKLKKEIYNFKLKQKIDFIINWAFI
jgi:hypothetical protein